MSKVCPQPQTPTTTAGTPPVNRSPDVKAACDGVVFNNDPKGSDAGKVPAVDSDKDHCGGAPAAKDPHGQPGTDAPGCPSSATPDKSFWTNLGNGISFGLAGLVMGSLFGGLLLTLAVAVVAGVAGYMMSRSITEPPPDPPKKDGG